jgi:hypothetical protein
MKRSALILTVLISIASIPADLSARSKHKYRDDKEQSMVADILYTTIGAGFLVAAFFAGKFTLNTYNDYRENGYASVANSKGFDTNKLVIWYKEHAEVLVPAEIISLAFFTGILGSTGIHCICKGLHLRN